ncbi:hypothetical protein E2C01_049944 [Portunus trituberculatus]|uniref:Uncharacterized protein n=1 Tax=Portunus trituberculatus TaxID=210409 RepID=A0A5B7GF53_PORTR|nr:hypothetical protein [Portunus trituberculatus]
MSVSLTVCSYALEEAPEDVSIQEPGHKTIFRESVQANGKHQLIYYIGESACQVAGNDGP